MNDKDQEGGELIHGPWHDRVSDQGPSDEDAFKGPALDSLRDQIQHLVDTDPANQPKNRVTRVVKSIASRLFGNRPKDD